ncbi:MAG: hypothetical protein ACJAZS_000151 [Alteromonas naphthalenivorans]
MKAQQNFSMYLKSFIDHYYLVGMACIAPIILYFNYDAQLRKGALEIYYKNFALIIKSWFDLSATTTTEPLTFPIWGYGWIMLITENHIALVTIQFALALFSVWYFIRTMEINTLLPKSYIRLFKLILLVSIPWYAFHSVRWPYSISSSLCVLSIAALYRGIKQEEWPSLFLSAIAFGLLLNFRSDYFLMPIGIMLIVLWAQCSIKNSKKILIWALMLYSFLIPWAFFTKKVCGHYLITSTNGGHVCLAGLGKYPNNKWGIAPINSDGCPVIHKFVDDVYGESACTWDYKGDKVLKSKFLELIKNDPWEYVKKCIYTFYLVVTEGVYNGEFIERENRSDIKVQKTKNFLRFFAIALQHFSRGLASHITLTSYLLLPVAIFAAFYTSNLFFLLMISVIGYQTALNVLCDHMTCYTNNVFFFFLLNIIYVLYAAFSNVGISRRRIK